MDLAFVRQRLRALREQVGLTQEQVAERADLSKNFVSAMERGAKGFGMDSFLRYVEALGLAPAQALPAESEAEAGAAVLSEEERQVIRGYRQLSATDRAHVRQCITSLGDPQETIRRLARQQLDVIERLVHGERLNAGDRATPPAEDTPAG